MKNYIHNHLEKECDTSILTATHRINDEIRKSSIPLVSQEKKKIGFICPEYNVIRFQVARNINKQLPPELLINCKLRRSQSSLHTARRCIPNVPTYISNDHEHQNGTINSSLVGVIIGDWKFYNHQGLCFNSKRSIRVGLMDITCGLMISQDRNLIHLFVTCIVLTDWTNMALKF
ncbi:hypothetical protein H8356DRAFT_1354121 [Neocallimastix lanati (nom. inval.)]|nr:hypothetical protein H8356DRAFT_1354121 [Neocallimastix sp. JGI-2020a]